MALYLIDGHALAYRSYFAFAANPLTNSKGEETSAVYGFLNTFLSLVDRFHPGHIAVAFDAAEKTFRHDMDDDYKANRPEMPDPLAAQLPVIFAALDAMGVRQFAVGGFEADDVIAAMCQRWRMQQPVCIVSGDKDLTQLLGDNVTVLRPGRGGSLERVIDAATFTREAGIKPEQVVDFLALTGDTSDNVPGVRGVGEKTATRLLQQYTSLDGIYSRLDEIAPPSVQKKLRDGREAAFHSRELVQLRFDVPLEVALDELVMPDFRTPAFRQILGELDFMRMRNQVFSARREATPPVQAVRPVLEATRAPKDDCDYTLVDDEKALSKLCQEWKALAEIAVDVETSGLDPMRAVLAGVSVAVSVSRAYYIPVRSEIEQEQMSLLGRNMSHGLALEIVRRHLGPVLAAAQPGKIGQNIKYDEIVLTRAGMPLSGVSFDTMLASYCLDPGRRSHGLDALALDFCAHEMISFESLFPARTARKDIRTVGVERVSEYACEDADYTLRLALRLRPMVEASTARSLFTDVELPLRDVLLRMEMTGVRVDVERLEAMSLDYGGTISRLEESIHALAGETFNINSTQRLSEILFDRIGLKPARKTKTGFSTDSDVLAGLSDAHPIVEQLLRYRQLMKLKGTYIDALPRLVHPETGRVHTSYNQAVASTGRLSSSDPNLQNIPIRSPEGRAIRRAFVAEDGTWTLLDADYSQIELRILAHLSGDAELTAAFRDDDDVHRRTAAKILGVPASEVSPEMRSRAKTVNFGIIYGMGARGLSQALEIPVDEARRFIDDYFRSYPGVKSFIDDTIAAARRDRAIATLMGRTRMLPDIDSSDPRARAFSERIAVNTPVQGTAADIIKVAMLRIDRRIRDDGLRSRMILQVHDELLFEVPLEELETMKALVRDGMQGAMVLDVPLKVDMGTADNWLDAH